MEKYKELLKKIICERFINKSDFVSINNIVFEKEGVTVYYEYYCFSNSLETSIDNISFYNSELNAYMYENIN